MLLRGAVLLVLPFGEARWGLSSKDFQILPIVDFDSPVRSAILARDQCVAFAGVDSNVATTTSSI